MKRFDSFSVYIRNFKCFGTERQGFQQVRRLNLIIGRNNTGKSALLDLVRFAVKPYDLSPYSYKHEVQPFVTLFQIIDEALIRRFFPRTNSGEGIPARTPLEYGLKMVGAILNMAKIKLNKIDSDNRLSSQLLVVS